jgi:hypothetical protein
MTGLFGFDVCKGDNIVVHSNLGHRLYSSSVLELVSYGDISSHFLLLFSGADCCKMRA